MQWEKKKWLEFKQFHNKGLKLLDEDHSGDGRSGSHRTGRAKQAVAEELRAQMDDEQSA